MRLPGALVDALDRYAADRGMTRTAAVEHIITDALRTSEDPTEGTERAGGTKAHNDELRAVVEVLRASNAGLREQVSHLYDQIRVKDKQIATAHDLADHAQALHMAEVQRALPAPRRRSLFDILMGGGPNE